MRFILHGGFHKTGATHIQRALLSQVDWLGTKSTVVVPPKDARKNGLITDDSERESILVQLAEKQPRCLIVSDESILGNVGQIVFTGDLHRFPGRPIDAFLSDFEHPPTDILLCVRNYSTFFSAAYAASIGPLAQKRFEMPDVVALKTMGNMPNWVRLVNVFINKFPKSKMTIYRYEDYDAVAPQLFDYLLGKDVGEKFLRTAEDVLSDQQPETPTEPMMDRFFESLTKNGLIDAYRDWSEIREDWIDGPIFDIWTELQTEHLTRTYEADCAELASDQRITMLTP